MAGYGYGSGYGLHTQSRTGGAAPSGPFFLIKDDGDYIIKDDGDKIQIEVNGGAVGDRILMDSGDFIVKDDGTWIIID